MRYRRMPIEVESPEQLGYGNIECNLAESSVSDGLFSQLGLKLDDLVLMYGDHLGKPELRAMIAGEGPLLHAEDVLLTVGAAAALFIVSTSLLEAGDRALVVFPNYATNIETPRQLGCQMDYFQLSFEGGFRIDVDALIARITPETKLVSVTCPHNPTGTMISENDLHRLVEAVENRGCRLLFDETYREMSFGTVLPPAASLSQRVISVSSLSKTYGLPGIRTGWILCRDRSLMETFLAAKEQIFISNPVVDEEIAYQFLSRKAEHLERIRAHIDTNFGILKAWMGEQTDYEWVEPQGGVVCFPRIKPESGVDVEKFYSILNTVYKTWVGPGHWFESDRRHMRVGFGWPTADELTRGLNNITQALLAAKD
ncbi:MAG: pyridoxal phosphate-dependent aminotransferase [Anaerolineae bacterium]|nr:pyridoxal phosphate-dependent aminotransferase [Anaerolineae bacterium]